MQYHSPFTEEDLREAYLQALEDVKNKLTGRVINGTLTEVVTKEDLEELTW